MDIFALLLQNLEKSLAADKKQKSSAVHPDLFEDLLHKSLDRTFSQKIASKVQPTLVPETSAKRSMSVFAHSLPKQTLLPMRDAQISQKLQTHEPNDQAKSVSASMADLGRARSEAKEHFSHPFMINIPAKSHPVQKETRRNEGSQRPTTLRKKAHVKADLQETLPKHPKKSRIAHPSSQNAEPLAQFVAIAAEQPAQPTPLHPKSHEKRVKTATIHRESVRNDAPQASKPMQTRIKNRSHDIAPTLQRSSAQPKAPESMPSVRPSIEPKSESILPHVSRRDTPQSKEAERPQPSQSAIVQMKMPQSRKENGKAAAEPLDVGSIPRHEEKSGATAPSAQQAIPTMHKEPTLQISSHKRPHHARYIDKNVSIAKRIETDAPQRHVSSQQHQPILLMHDTPKDLPQREESVATLSQPKRIAETQEQPQNMAQQHAHSFDSGDSFEAHQAESAGHVMDEHAFEQLRRHEVRTIQLRFDQTLVNVTMHQRQLSLNFVSSQSMQLDGNIAEVVDAIMQESGYERYKVTLRDRERRITIDSKGREAARSEARSGVNVKV